jgi:predicted lipase
MDFQLMNYSEDFDLNIARTLLELSDISYHKPSKIHSLVSDLGFNVKLFVEKDNQQALIVYNDTLIVTIFPGTDIKEVEDIIVDLQFFPTKTEMGKVNTGFYSVYKKLKFDVYRSILELQKEKERQLYWAGHSLGGAVAILFATFYGAGTVYTYGCPKVGDKKFCEVSDSKIKLYRILNAKDIFPILPPWILGYKHSGDEYNFSIKDYDKENSTLYEDILAFILTFVVQLWSRLLSKAISGAWWAYKRFKYHRTDFYKELLSDSNSFTVKKSLFKK